MWQFLKEQDVEFQSDREVTMTTLSDNLSDTDSGSLPQMVCALYFFQVIL